MLTNKKNMLTVAIISGLLLVGAPVSQAFKQVAEPPPAKSNTGLNMPHAADAEERRAMLNAIAMMQEGDSDAMVARVNDTTISMRLLMDRFKDVLTRKYQNKSIGKDVAQRLRVDTLDRIIMEELAYQRGISLGIVVDPSLLATTMASIKVEEGREEALNNAEGGAVKSQVSKEQEIERYLLIRETVARDVTSKAIVPEEEITSIYEEIKEELAEPEMVVITDVVFFLDPDLPASVEKVKDVRQKIVNESSGHSVKLEGDGFIVESRLDVSASYKPLLYKAAREMEAGTFSDPLVIDGTLHLIKLEYYRPRRELSESEARTYIGSKLKATKKNELLTQWRQKLRQEADVEINYELLK
jgi:parvulin-like peptidyl-prolyl isomerase